MGRSPHSSKPVKMTGTSQDPVIHQLVRKKKELLSRLLALSIQTAINDNPATETVQHRILLMSALDINDRALEKRERDIKISAKTQEARLFRDINSILQAIQENNTQTIGRLQREIKKVELERFQLQHGNKLTGYITQQRGYKGRGAAGSIQTSQASGRRLLDGTL